MESIKITFENHKTKILYILNKRAENINNRGTTTKE